MRKLNEKMFALGALIALALLSPLLTMAQIDTTMVSDPGTIVSAANVETLTVAITVLLSFMSGIIPGLKNIKSSLLRSVAVGIIVVIATVSFKIGWFNQESFAVILGTLLPNFAYSGTVWEVLKFLLGLFKIDIKAIRPGIRPTKGAPNTLDPDPQQQ